MRSFKNQYLQNNENVKVTSKYKHFQTFSLVEPKMPSRSSIMNSLNTGPKVVEIETSRDINIKKNNSFQENI